MPKRQITASVDQEVYDEALIIAEHKIWSLSKTFEQAIRIGFDVLRKEK